MKYFISIVFFIGLILLAACSKESSSNGDDVIIYSTGAEFLNGNHFTDSAGVSEFEGITFQSEEFSHSGKSSIKLDSTHIYGFGLTIDDPKEGELYQASVWQKKGALDGTLICSIEGKNTRVTRTWRDHYQQDEWFKHSMSLIVGKDVEKLSFYVFAGGKEAFFDDIVIKRFPEIPTIDEAKSKNISHLNLYIPEPSKLKLESYVENALSANVISKKNKKYVDAFIIADYDSIPIEMRLKGDWTDHLTSGKISYRIKVKGNNAFMGLKTFSIQHPGTRNYMHEWFMHKLCDEEDLLSTKYEMSLVTINGVNKGVYAVEEHFDKQLLESRNRREGPILKLDESGMWQISYLSSEEDKNKSYPYFGASYVSLFKKSRTLKNKNLRNQFIEGGKLLNKFKDSFENQDQLFDLKSSAKYFALLELGNVVHAHAWHNSRFYINPVTQKLEMIGYDMLPGIDNGKDLFFANKLRRFGGSEELHLRMMLLNSKEFKSYYLTYLEEFSDSLYLESKFSKLDSSINQYETVLAFEIEDYYFNKQFYLDRAKKIRKDLPKLDSTWQVFLNLNYDKNDFIIESNYTPNIDTFYIEEISVNAYTHKLDSAQYQVELENYHLNDVTIIGYKIKGDSLIAIEEPILLRAFSNQGNMSQADFIVNNKPKEIVFKISNNPERVYSKKILKWEKPKGNTARMELEASFQVNSPFYKINGSILTFNKGDYKVDKLLYIPSRYEVVINKGTSINFINGGGIIANNSFVAEGTDQHPIHIYSSDGNNHGVTILQGEFVNMSYVNFDSLNTLHYKKWHLTGAVSIYESETDMKNCRITNNICEDGLNIIRSNFIIDSLFVSGTKSDGFDADFCTGEIKNSRFESTGNDCIDFSGSVVDINNIEILNSGDKGISGGERSELTISNINIDGAITGIAAKDDTKIIGDNITVNNAEFGVAAFQKKAEYNKASIRLTNVDYSNLLQYGLVDLGSYVVINGKYYYGGMVIDVDELYSRFEK